VRVERTGDGVTRRPPVLKTGRITGPHALPKEISGFRFQVKPPRMRGFSRIRTLKKKT
jgi:hypothetical protein